MDRCVSCSELTDTDFDCQFYDFAYLIKDMNGHCSGCRDDLYEKMTATQQAEHERKTYG